MTDKPLSPPRVLQWYSGGLGVVWDEGLNLLSHDELERWMQNGKESVIVDYVTGEDVTGIFMAHRTDSTTHVIDPMK
jgi:hypothetical protein